MSLTVGLWNTVMNIFAAKSETTSAAPAQWLIDWVRGGEPTLSGVSVTPDSALQLSAVWACVRIRSEDIGKIPCFLYRRLPDGGKERAVSHPLYSLIRDQPNPYQTALEFRQLLQAWVDLRGNGYALKEIDARGRVVALWPINPKWVTVLRVPGTWEIFYQLTIPYTPNEIVPAEAMLHVRGMTMDGFVGMSPIAHHRETIGLALASMKYGSAFFGNSAQPNGAIKVPAVLTKPAADALRSQWEEKYRGVDNAKKIAIFDGGMDWVQTGVDNVDAQYLEVRQFQDLQIFSIYRVPPHKAGMLDRATHSNIEHQALEYISDCLMTEMVRWEQALKRDLLTEQDIKDGYFFEFLPDALLRGDQKTRYEAYAIGRNWGWLSVNDIRERENMNRVANGDIRLEPLNMIEAGKPRPVAGTAPGATPATQTPGSTQVPDVAGAAMIADWTRDNPDQPRDEQGRFASSGGGDGAHGRWTSGGLAATSAWLKTSSAKDVLNSVAHSHRVREALVFGINSLIAHGSQMHGSFLDSHVEETVSLLVHNFSDVAAISLQQAKDYMGSAVQKLADLRAREVVAAKALAPQDQVLEFLHFIAKAIDNLDVTPEQAAMPQPHVNGHDQGAA